MRSFGKLQHSGLKRIIWCKLLKSLNGTNFELSDMYFDFFHSGAHNFWANSLTEKLFTVLDSLSIQNSKIERSFSVVQWFKSY